jgi:hypothetical protein
VIEQNEEGMRGIRLVETTVAASLVFASSAAADWKGDVARQAVGRAVRAGLENAIKDAALDAALETATEAATYAAPQLRDIDERVTFSVAVSEGVETAMRVADVASTLDDVADVAKTVKKIKKLKR